MPSPLCGFYESRVAHSLGHPAPELIWYGCSHFQTPFSQPLAFLRLWLRRARPPSAIYLTDKTGIEVTWRHAFQNSVRPGRAIKVSFSAIAPSFDGLELILNRFLARNLPPTCTKPISFCRLRAVNSFLIDLPSCGLVVPIRTWLDLRSALQIR